MAMRTSTRDAARRAMTNASRGTLRELNSKPYWSEAKHVDVMNSETHTDVEFIENYGSTSVPAKQDEEEEGQQQKQQQQGGGGGDGGFAGAGQGEKGEQPQGDAAEPIILYLNGSRSHPVMIAIGDRRHRLVELEEGDVAQHRLQKDRQQLHMHKDGTYLSTRSDKVMRIALVPKQDDDSGQQKPGPQQAKGQQKKKKEYGQKSARDDNKKSEVAIEQNGTTTYSRHGEAYASQKGSSDTTTHYEKDKKKSTQVTEDHTHIRFKEHRIFNDADGNWWTTPCLVKKDKYCKEG
jgi:hypothetical protein